MSALPYRDELELETKRRKGLDRLATLEQARVAAGFGTTSEQPDAGERLVPFRAVVAMNLGVDDESKIKAPLVFLLRWRTAEDHIGHAATVRDVAEFWGESERTVFRHLDGFRRAFPGEQSPSRLARGAPRSLPRGWRSIANADVPLG